MNDDLYRAMLNDGIIREDVISKMADRIAFLSQRLADAEAALDSIETSNGLTSNGNVWRFWRDQAREAVSKLSETRAVANLFADLIKGDATGVEWKRGCAAALKAHRELTKGKGR